MPILGLVITLVIIVLSTYMGGTPRYFIDMPSVIAVAGLTIGAFLQSRAGIGTMLKGAFSSNLSDEEMREAADSWAHARTFVLAAGWIGFLVGLIHILNTAKLFEHPKAIPLGVATILITVVYAHILSYLIFLPIVHRLRRRLN